MAVGFQSLVSVYEDLQNTSKKLEKTYIIAKFLKTVGTEELPNIIYLLQGSVLPPFDKRELGVSDKLAIKILAMATGSDETIVEKKLSSLGDLGLVAEELLKKRRQLSLVAKKNLTVNDVVENIKQLFEITGKGAVDKKIKQIVKLLSNAKPGEAKYIIRIILEKLRTGVASGTLRDAIVFAFLPKVIGVHHYCANCKTFTQTDKCYDCNEKVITKFKDEVKQNFHNLKVLKVDDLKELNKISNTVDVIIPANEKLAREFYNRLVSKVQNAYDMVTDYGLIGKEVKVHGLKCLEQLNIQPGRAIKVMLYVKAKDFDEAFDIVGKPALAERKFDGFRMQIHGINNEVKLFTRRLDDVTMQFPDIVKMVMKCVKAKSFILDSEIVGIDPKSKKFLPFQNISQRIKRKYGIKEMVKELPVIVEIFDIMFLNGESLLNYTYKQRRIKLKSVVREEKSKLAIVESVLVSNTKQLKKFYDSVLDEGVEGVMLKNLNGIYKPGARVGYGVKLKPVYENLDLVIVGAEWGEGKRSNWLSSFTLACRDGSRFKEIGKVGTGLKEKSDEGVSFADLTKRLKPLIVEQKGKYVKVKPVIVLEIAYQEIQKSPSYSSGYALRFPRVVRDRSAEKSVDDINTVKDVERFYKQQKIFRTKK